MQQSYDTARDTPRQAEHEDLPPATEYAPEPNILERRFATHLAAQSDAENLPDHPSQDRIDRMHAITRWTIAISALAGIISGGLIGGAEVWMRHGYFDGMEDMGWRETWPYWLAFYAFAGVVSAIEIAALYVFALRGVAKVTHLSGLAMLREKGRGLLAYSLARAALEFPNPQVHVYGIDPYAHVANWKLTALNIAYRMKVGVSSFILRVFLRRVAARMAIRGFVPLMAGPLYAVWNAYIIWKIMTEGRVRTMGPFAVDKVISEHFDTDDTPPDFEQDVILQGAGEMMTCGRDAHPNQIYLIARLRKRLGRMEDIALNWPAHRDRLAEMEDAAQTRVLDVLTVSCLIGTRIHSEQKEMLRNACKACGLVLDEDRLKELRRDFKHGEAVTLDRLKELHRSES